MSDEQTPAEVLTLLNERIMAPRVGVPFMRLMDKDILAMHSAASAMSGLCAALDRVTTVIQEHERAQAHNELVPLNRLSDLIAEPTAEQYRAALEGTA